MSTWRAAPTGYTPRQFHKLPDGMGSLTVTDFFCGAGGSSTGMAMVPGIKVQYAANHWNLAIEVHNANHQDTDHSLADLHEERPSFFTKTDILWASPECRKWSQAGGAHNAPEIEPNLFEDPESDEARVRSRLLMFDVLKFAEYHKYRVMIVENVVDIAVQAKYRKAWWAWRVELDKIGYNFRVLSINSMHAQAYGAPAPQSRDRIYVLCWLKGTPAPNVDHVLRPLAYCPRCEQWVESRQVFRNGRTVGRYRQAYDYRHYECQTIVEPGYLPAASIIDWSNPGVLIGDRLSAKTRERVAMGIARWWSPLHVNAAGQTYDAADPAHRNHGDPGAYYRAWPATEPLQTQQTTNSTGLVVPVEGRDGKHAAPADAPLRAQTTRAETGIAQAPFVAELRGGGSDVRPVTDPAATFCASGNHHGLVTPAGGSWNEDALPTSDALRTLTTRDAYGVARPPFVMTNNHQNRARTVDEAAPTVTTATGGGQALVSPTYSGTVAAHPVDHPMGTQTAVDRHALVHRNNGGGAEMTTPVTEYLRTLTTAGHQSLIHADPGRKTPRPSAADVDAARRLVPDCYFRMFTPAEVALGMAFPDTYQWQPHTLTKKISNRDLVKMGGNAVTPPVPRDLLAAVVASW